MNFPLDVRFKLLALTSQIAVRDASGQVCLYVKQKAFKLKEAVTVYADEAQQRPVARINADRVLDFSARYAIDDADGHTLGAIQRQGMRSFWRAHYDVSRGDQPVFTIREENPWVSVADGLLTQVPVLGMFAGYLFHPAYLVTRTGSDTPSLRVVKQPAMWEGRFLMESAGALDVADTRLAVLSVLMLLLLERRDG